MSSKRKITFTRYSVLPAKARISMLQEKLIEHGYSDICASGKRDKPTVKALMDFQKKHDIIPNGVVCEETFKALNN